MTSVNITPSPRVLRMLGQIDFKPWQCLAELIDNSIDAFIEAAAEGTPPTNPKVTISLPSDAQLRNGDGHIEVRDNGRGMTLDDMGNAVRAGYSGNDPVDKMGLFGMGFNISTARLGRRTEVWSTTRESEEWTGIIIDFRDLEKSKSFDVPIETRPKTEDELSNHAHGTSIKISGLDEDRIRPLIRGAGKGTTKKRLGKIYGHVMQKLDLAISYDGDRIVPTKHCVWDAKRTVENKMFGHVPAWMEIDVSLPVRRFCSTCWVWLADTDRECNACGLSAHVIERERSIKGWIGVQRYFDQKHFGFDLIRNGRVIQELDKSLFNFEGDDIDPELEYPIDTTHWGGRLVGELEIDFVRVTHQKDAFDKHDPEWREVVEHVRGASPLRPQVATRMGLPQNVSPLARLFAGYRSGRDTGLKGLVPGGPDGSGMNTGPVMEYLDKFLAGEEAYQSDEKWYELVLQAERGKRGGGSSGEDDAAGGGLPIDDDDEEDFEYGEGDGDEAGEGIGGALHEETNEPEKVEWLSQIYELDLPGNPCIRVDAYQYDHDIDGKAYQVMPASGTFRFDFNPKSEYFENSLDSPVDFLLTDLANHLLASAGQAPKDFPVSSIARQLREKYFPSLSTELSTAVRSASSIIQDIKLHYNDVLPTKAPIENITINQFEKDHIYRVAQRAKSVSRSEVDEIIRQGTFVEYVTDRYVLDLILNWPEIATNGEFFVSPYESDEAGGDDTNAVLTELCETIRDVLWLKDDGVAAINKDQVWHARYARALASLRLLERWRA